MERFPQKISRIEPLNPPQENPKIWEGQRFKTIFGFPKSLGRFMGRVCTADIAESGRLPPPRRTLARLLEGAQRVRVGREEFRQVRKDFKRGRTEMMFDAFD